MDRSESTYAQIQLFASKKEGEKFQQIVFVNRRLEEFIYIFDVMNSVDNKGITNEPLCTVL